MAIITVLGGRGFIGSEIVKQLEKLQHEVYVPLRDDLDIFNRDLGYVIYAAGSGDCKNAPFSVVDANINLLAQILQKSTFKRLLYISSTRVYMNQDHSGENDDLLVCTADNRRLFNLTKLVGEELCFKSNKDICIVRPSNVYGVALHSPLFLPAITRNAINNGVVDMFIAKEYAKDYVSVTDVASSCIALVLNDESNGKVINIAAGINVTAQQIADVLESKTGCEVVWHQGEFPKEEFPQTDVTEIKAIIPCYKPASVLADLADMVNDFRAVLSKN
jgi:nucleoside-diphosphate-sugar epimerase